MTKQYKLHAALVEPLRTVTRVLYYRFEFARGYSDYDYFGKNLSSDIGNLENPDDNDNEHSLDRWFPTVASRKSFLSPPGGTTYLDDLKADLDSAGQKRPWAMQVLVSYIEDVRAPLSPFASVLWSRRLDPFFPSHRDIGARLLEYIRQLFELQKFLSTECGLHPGAILPVWILDEGGCEDSQGANRQGDEEADNEEKKKKKPLPSFGMRSVPREISDALINYLLWERELDFQARMKPVDFSDENNPLFFDNVLRFARLLAFRQSEEFAIDADTEQPFEENKIWYRRREIFESVVDRLPEHLRDFPITLAEELFNDLESRDELTDEKIRPKEADNSSNPNAPANSSGRSVANRSFVNDQSFRNLVKRAGDVGGRLFCGEYKDWWGGSLAEDETKQLTDKESEE